MLSMLPKETYTLEEFQKTLGELAEKIPERTAECTAIKRRFLNLAKATVVWDYLDAKVLQKSHPAIPTFSLKEYQKLIYDLAMTIPIKSELLEDRILITSLTNLYMAEVSFKHEHLGVSSQIPAKDLLVWDDGGDQLPLCFISLQLTNIQVLALLRWFDEKYGDTDQDIQAWAVEYQLCARMLLHSHALILNPQHLDMSEVLPELYQILGFEATNVYKNYSKWF